MFQGITLLNCFITIKSRIIAIGTIEVECRDADPLPVLQKEVSQQEVQA